MSLFSRKHYKAIARAVDDSRLSSSPDTITAHWLIKVLSVMFRLDNPRFNEETFRVACGEKPEHSD